MCEKKAARAICERFAIQHKLIFEDEGECGFLRDCVGFLSRSGNWIAHNPYNSIDYKPVPDLECAAAYPPKEVKNAYHKYDCLAILGRGEEAIHELALWVLHLESQGTVSVRDYETGATGLQLLTAGMIDYAIFVEVGE